MRLDNWNASVLVVHVNPDPVVTVLSPESVRGDEIALHQLEAKCRTNASSVLPLNLSDPSAELGSMDNEGLPICPQDTRITISYGWWGDDMLCLLIFSGGCGELACGWQTSLAGDCLGPRHYWYASPAPLL